MYQCLITDAHECMILSCIQNDINMLLTLAGLNCRVPGQDAVITGTSYLS